MRLTGNAVSLCQVKVFCIVGIPEERNKKVQELIGAHAHLNFSLRFDNEHLSETALQLSSRIIASDFSQIKRMAEYAHKKGEASIFHLSQSAAQLKR